MLHIPDVIESMAAVTTLEVWSPDIPHHITRHEGFLYQTSMPSDCSRNLSPLFKSTVAFTAIYVSVSSSFANY